MDGFCPLTLKRQQFGVLAATVILLAAIPMLVALKQPSHLIPLDIDALPDSWAAHDPIFVSILASNEIRADGRPVDLTQLGSLAKQAQAQSRAIFVDPDDCALHEILVTTVAVLQETGHKGVRLAPPRFPIKFGRGTREPKRSIEGAYISREQSLPENALLRFRTTYARTIILPEECGVMKSTYQPDRNQV